MLKSHAITRLALPLAVAAGLGLGAIAPIAATPAASPLAPRQALAATSSADQAKIDAVFTDTADHKGTLGYGGMTITIPESYEVVSFNSEANDSGEVYVNGKYETDNGILLLEFYNAETLADIVKSGGDSSARLVGDFCLLAVERFDDATIVKSAELVDNTYIGLAVAEMAEVGDLPVFFGGAFDDEGNCLFFQYVGIGDSEDLVEEISKPLSSITGNINPDTATFKSSSATTSSSSATVKTPVKSSATYTDGTYASEGRGIGGKVPVTVTIKDGVIASVEVGDNSETQGIGSKAIEQLPDLIVAANGIDGVDAVSGASVTSKAIFTAVNDCLEQASD